MRFIFSVLVVMILFNTACSQINSQAKGTSKILSINDYIQGKEYGQLQVATLAGGCFWCTEAAFEQIEGVIDVISGYTAGKTKHPTYEQVGSGRTGHTEGIQIYYDPTTISFEELLDIFWVAHDPTQLNRQGPDVGTQYRSGIYYHNEEQKQAAEQAIAYLNQSGKLSKPIATEVEAYQEFWVAEAYHQDYYWHNPGNPYVQRISKPKVEKVKKVFAHKLKKDFQKS